MSTEINHDLAGFAASLIGKKLGIVYSSRFEGKPADTWYHRWRSDVIGLFSSAAEALGMEQVFFNVDQYLDALGRIGPTNIDYIANLNAGNRFLGNLALVPAVARWHGIPVAFCDARTAIVSEDKRLSRLFAAEAGFRMPRKFDELKDGDAVICKPANLGSSVGVSRKLKGEPLPDGHIVEEFIEGLDGTIVLVFASDGSGLIVLGAQLVLPEVEHPHQWIYSEAAKECAPGTPHIEYRKIKVSSVLAEKARSLSKMCGSKAVARVDIRYTGIVDSEITLDERNSTFIEFNAMPTMSRVNSVNELTRVHLEQNEDTTIAKLIYNRTNDVDVRSACYLLVVGLLGAQLQMK